jgi:hypothetical protein
MAVTGIAAAGSVALVIGLILLGTASEGPISGALRSLGGFVSDLESRMMHRLRGPGRAARLSWLGPARESVDSLRRPAALLLGAYDEAVPYSLDPILSLEDTLGVTFPLLQVYTAWGDEPDHRFPERLVEAIHGLGSIPVVTWEPWITTFENRLHPGLPLRESRDETGLHDISLGMYDFYIQTWAEAAARFEKPLLVRLAHEMNDPYRYPWGPQNNEPQEFIAAWRHVVERFREAGATNVLWVWSPHVAYAGYEVYWPGDDYVDWVGTGSLNYGTVAYWSQWWSFDDIFGRHYEFLAGFGKPIIIAEFGTLEVGGDRAEWYASALKDFPTRFPQVKGLLFFHVEGDRTVTRQALDWTFEDDGDVVAAIRGALSDSAPASDQAPR